MEQSKFNQRRRKVDRRAAFFVRLGGLGVILAVLFIGAFLVFEVLPLIKSPKIQEIEQTVELPVSVLAGVEEFTEGAWLLGEDGHLRLFEIDSGDMVDDWPAVPLQEGERLVRAKLGINRNWISTVSSLGRLFCLPLKVETQYDEELNRSYSLTEGRVYSLLEDGFAEGIEEYCAHVGEEGVVAVLVKPDGSLAKLELVVEYNEFLDETSESFEQSSISTAEKISHVAFFDRNYLVAATREGEVLAWNPENEVLEVKEIPAGAPVTAMASLIGRGSVLVGREDGTVDRLLWLPSEEGPPKVVLGNRFEEKQEGLSAFATSNRQRVFLAVGKEGALVGQATRGEILNRFDLPEDWSFVQISPREDKLAVFLSNGQLELYPFEPGFPQVGAQSLFQKIQYEGYSSPDFTWQSTGGSQEYEPKISLVPLIVGTLKGTLWALLPSIPLAILGALYTARFLGGKTRESIKSFVELLSGVPSVILGFVGALYLAPAIQDRFLVLALTPLVLVVLTLILGAWFAKQPPARRARIRQGKAFLLLLPLYGLISWLMLSQGANIEKWVFGTSMREWATATFDITFEIRNSVVVGLAMGFAVTPLIFTLAEDAFRNVPKHLVEASLALGGTDWQTARRVVMPYARPGVIAAVMLGLGRAVGETMIVLMATGNTAITEWNPLQGFRALSANLAVELPEAPHGGFLYRTLFLSALILFGFTFALNTLAEMLRARNRRAV
ncbi:MAG: ABC transporter permease subunit [Planctomycetota bacterium]|nr:MAG: ABC transporter permease subunit [Planctomycetota bacterium]